MSQKSGKSVKKVAPPEKQVRAPLADKGISFFNFLFSAPQKKELLVLLGIYVVIYFLWSWMYPLPMFTGDSGNYIYCAKEDVYGGYRPIGYSWFLQFFHWLSDSYSFVGFMQYWLHAIACVLFVFTIKYFFPPARKIWFYLFAISVLLSPTSLFLSSWLMSDSIFITLTLLWIITGFWLVRDLKWYTFILHLVIIYLAVQVRFAGLFYPVFSILFLIYFHRWRSVIYAIFALLLPFMIYSGVKKDTREIFGLDVFSGFSGWAQANNAVSMIPYIDLKPEEIEDPELGQVHHMISMFPDSCFKTERIIQTTFMWHKQCSGKNVMGMLGMRHPRYQYVQHWIYTGEVLNDYGRMLIFRFPFKYIRHYILPNIWQVIHPMISIGGFVPHKTDDIVKDYYEIEADEIMANKDLMEKIDPFLPWANSLMWLVILGAGAWAYVKRKSFTFTPTQKGLFAFTVLFMLAYLAFIILGHPVHLRYMAPIHAVQISFLFIIINSLTPLQNKTSDE